jgi:hypothetical protein
LTLLQENIGRTLEHTGTGNYSLTRTSIAQEIRARINKQDCIKFKSFCSSITGMKRPPTEWEKIFASYSMDKGLISRIHKMLKKLNTKRPNNPIYK